MPPNTPHNKPRAEGMIGTLASTKAFGQTFMTTGFIRIRPEEDEEDEEEDGDFGDEKAAVERLLGSSSSVGMSKTTRKENSKVSGIPLYSFSYSVRRDSKFSDRNAAHTAKGVSASTPLHHHDSRSLRSEATRTSVRHFHKPKSCKRMRYTCTALTVMYPCITVCH